MEKKAKHVSLFDLQGQLRDFIIEDGYKIKGCYLVAAETEYRIKFSKEARASVGQVLHRGDWLQVWGEKTVKGEGEEKLKAYKIRVLSSNSEDLAPPAKHPQPQKRATQATILVCQKSDCMKRGGKAVCQALAQELSDRHLTDQVTVRMTGCMKHCKAGPNLVVLPAKTRYSRITAADIPALLDQHLPMPMPTSSV